jgi:hypothetical protein
MLVIIKRLVMLEIAIIISNIIIIATTPGILFSFRKLYRGSKINEMIIAIKKGISIVLSSLRITNAITIISRYATTVIILLFFSAIFTAIFVFML